jgi:hypothetical protein
LLYRDFKAFIELLRSIAVEFLVVGAHALAADGRPCCIGDINIWVRPEQNNIARLIDALNSFGFGTHGARPLISWHRRQWFNSVARPCESI